VSADQTVLDAAVRALVDRGPLSELALTKALAGAGFDLGADPRPALNRALNRSDLVVLLADKCLAWLPALLEGRVFTHLLTGPEVEYDLLAGDPDFAPLTMLFEDLAYAHLVDGAQIALVLAEFDANALVERGIPRRAVPADGGLLLPPGYLRGKGCAEGDLVAVRVTATGLSVELVDGAALEDALAPGAAPAPLAVGSADSADSAELGGCLRAILAVDPTEPVALETATWTACAHVASLFRQPGQPLGDAFDALGLAREGEWIALPGFDYLSWLAQRRIAGLARKHDLSEDEALALLAMITLYLQLGVIFVAAQERGDGAETAMGDLGPGRGLPGSPETVRATLRFLAEPAIAEALLLETLPSVDYDELEADDDWNPSSAEPGVTDADGAEPDGGDADGAQRQGRGAADQAEWDGGEAAGWEPNEMSLDGWESDSERAAVLGLFTETFEPLAPRSARPALRWLRGKALERLGQILAAETSFLAAQSLDPDWPLALLELARYASDRGDATRGLDLLRRAGAPPQHPLVELLTRFEVQPRAGLRRNDPCWCGSGRKYKQCHLHRERPELAERAWWLYQKAGMFLVDAPVPEALIDAADERARFGTAPFGEEGADPFDEDGAAPFDENADTVAAAMNDPLVADAVLFEGGVFAEFLAARGALLPDDERSLAEQWLLIERSVFEVQAVRPGEGLTVRDLRTGDIHEVQEGAASRQLTVGALICARVVPAGDAMQVFGGIESVALHQRDELLALLDNEPDPVELVAFLTRRFAPPTLQNTEGDPLAMCAATLHVRDPAALATELDGTYEREEPAADLAASADPAAGEPAQWIEYVTTHGMRRVRATLLLSGTELRVETNSEARLDRVLDVLRSLQPSLIVTAEKRQAAGDMHEAMKLAGAPPPDGSDPAGGHAGPGLDPADPQVAAMLNEFVQGYERSWVDEPIPALAGCTPRQAAADPSRRPDLIRLLDSFPPASEDAPGVMSPDRLRAVLGLQ